MARAKVYITNRQSKAAVPVGVRMLIKRCCNAVLTLEKFGDPAEISVSFIDNENIAELNKAYRGKDTPTDVLSFGMGEDDGFDLNQETGARILGDIVISLEQAVEQARLYGHSLEREIGFLVVHSMLHLLGYDHENGGIQARIMRDKEEKVLLQLGLSRDETYVVKET